MLFLMRRYTLRMVEGWACTSNGMSIKVSRLQTPDSRLQTPESDPVLTLLGSKDPWFQNSYTNSECTDFLNKSSGSKSIVYTEGDLSYRHELLEDKVVQKAVLTFLKRYIR